MNTNRSNVNRLKVSIVVLLLAVGCAKAPPTLSPAGTQIWQANEAVVALGTLQHVAIELNALKVCAAPPATTCSPVLSDANTRTVVDTVTAALLTIKQVPTGWKATATAALTQIEQRLDALGKAKVAAYVGAARTVVNSL